MTNSVKAILARLDPYWEYIVCRPLSDGEILQIETVVGLSMPQCLKEFLETIGLFQDLVGDLFRFPEDFEFESRDFLPIILGDSARDYFPYADDNAGNLYTLWVEESSAHIYYIDHELKRAIRLEETFFQWLEIAVDTAIEDINTNKRKPNTQKAWCIQFCFTTHDFQKILDVLRQAGSVELPDITWCNQDISTAGVRSTHLNFKFGNESFVLKRLEYAGWETPQYFFNMDEPVTTPLSSSRIYHLDSLFQRSDLGYKLIDYGPLSRGAST